jgi:hypothetical protein
LRRIRIPSSLERLNGRSSIEAYEGAKEIVQKDDPGVLPSVIKTLLHGQRVLNRAAAAYALNLAHGKAVIQALERTLLISKSIPRSEGKLRNPSRITIGRSRIAFSVKISVTHPRKFVFGALTHLPKWLTRTRSCP